MRVSLSLLAAGLIAAATVIPAPAHAADFNITAGRSVTSGSRWTSSAFVNAGGGVYDWHGLHLQPVGTLGWVKSRDTPHDHLDHDVFVAGGGLRLVSLWHGAFFSFQLGVAGGRTDALSSAGQFISSLGWQGDHWVVMVRHISNGRIFPGKNLGETMLVAGLRF